VCGVAEESKTGISLEKVTPVKPKLVSSDDDDND